jgi:alpha-L-fucosidase
MKYRVPGWYRDAKLGIIVQWGVPAIPAYAPVEHGTRADMLRDQDWAFYFRNHPNAEWYLNSLRISDSPVRRSHRARFGEYTSYERLARRFNDGLDRWNPAEWAGLFREAGARYIIMVAKHHDGFLMWPSETPPATPSFVAARDVVGELALAVRELGMRYGVSYSGRLDWTVQTAPIRDFADLLFAGASPEYGRYVDAHLTELIRRYSPDLLRSDIGLPAGVSERSLFARYREAVPEGVLNDGWQMNGGPLMLRTRTAGHMIGRKARSAVLSGSPPGATGDVPTVEYPAAITMRSTPWELVRALGRSPAWNAAAPASSYLSGEELIHLLADVVSRNGNLLLSVAPGADGSICAEQISALNALAGWMRVHGEAIYATRPWVRTDGQTADGLGVRYTAREGALYAIVLGRPRMLELTLLDLDLDNVPRAGPANDNDHFQVRLLGHEGSVEWREAGKSVVIDIPGSFIPDAAIVVKFAWRDTPESRTDRFYTDLI